MMNIETVERVTFDVKRDTIIDIMADELRELHHYMVNTTKVLNVCGAIYGSDDISNAIDLINMVRGFTDTVTLVRKKRRKATEAETENE